MIDISDAKHQIRRLSGLKGYPSGVDKPEANDELVVALASASSVEQAKTLISDWIAENENAPKPKHIHDMLRAAQDAEPRIDPVPLGTLIADFGFEIITDDLIAKVEGWVKSERRDLAALGKKTLAGINARRASMSEEDWRAERRRANEGARKAGILPATRRLQ